MIAMLIGQAHWKTVRSRRTSQTGAPWSCRRCARGPARAEQCLNHAPPAA